MNKKIIIVTLDGLYISTVQNNTVNIVAVEFNDNSLNVYSYPLQSNEGRAFSNMEVWANNLNATGAKIQHKQEVNIKTIQENDNN